MIACHCELSEAIPAFDTQNQKAGPCRPSFGVETPSRSGVGQYFLHQQGQQYHNIRKSPFISAKPLDLLKNFAILISVGPYERGQGGRGSQLGEETHSNHMQ